MKKILGTALSCLFVMTAVAACSSDTSVFLPGISVGASDAEFSGTDLADALESTCNGDCDGDLDNIGLADVPTNDADALRNLVQLLVGPGSELDNDDLEATDRFADVTEALTEETELTFNVTRTTYCNSTGTGGSAAGNGAGGAIIETFVVTTTYDDMGRVPGADYETTRTVIFANCLIEGNLLDQPAPAGITLSNESAVRLNGQWTAHYFNAETPSEGTPDVNELYGTVTLSTDGDGDGIFGKEFWTHVVNLDAIYQYDGSDAIQNGGMCAGEAIEFDGDDTTDSGDNCAETTDMINDAWFSAGSLVAVCE